MPDNTARLHRVFERERARRGQQALDLLWVDSETEVYDDRYPILKTLTHGFYGKGITEAYQVRIADQGGQGDYEPVDLKAVFEDEISHIRIDQGLYYKVHHVGGPARQTRVWTIKCSATGEETPT